MNRNKYTNVKTSRYFTALMTVFLVLGSHSLGNGAQVNPGLKSSPTQRPQYTHIISYATVYYLSGPQQSRPPEGKFKAGQRVRLIQGAGSYSFVESENNISAYVLTDSLKRISPQVTPVTTLLKSIIDNNVNLFQSAYSKRMQEYFNRDDEFKGDWGKILKYYSKIIRKGVFGSGGFGNFRLKDFHFSYNGSETEGVVTLIYKGKPGGELDVINEGGVWKIDEK